ncbi:armadillo-type protein [Thamnidium elegans]|nr:armadillo-type protein [Thamnidium elegans]
MCQFAPSSTPFFSSATDSLYQRYNNQQQPLTQKPTPFFLIPTTNPQTKSKKQNERRSTNTDQDRFADAKIDDFVGKLYELCKDQNGCRFLQKKIEEKENGIKNLEIVFNEIYPHFTELMTDSFGNYLCQKMLERCNNEQRTIIVDIVAPELVKIALNMHGTRAVQKLIEYLSTEQQIKTVTSALNSNVVTLIKDLNGNHVIQKCLHRLSAENNQFIYDAVCANCIEVASHKHGCCVLQRCFDHATIPQKDQLVNEIARHALPLVKNPFGNYVVQYVLELGVTKYSESVIRRFVNHVCTLSVQKFSSNVIENCIRTAEPPTRRLLIAELVNQTVMEKLLHDSFANYVVQTSLDFADEDQRAELVECIRPLLPTIRSTPYGKRIHSKIFRDTNKSGICNKSQSTQQQRQRHRQGNDTENLDEETLDQ